MYTGKGFEVSELGDVDVIRHNDLFHLFHLVLPNHDYIAHAVSNDGLLWRRVKNPIFIGEPGSWDDDMLWTMHVSPDPDGPSAFRMFYTGLSRKESGRIQRIGLARSNDLYYWEKVSSSSYPLSITGPHYEESVSEGRHWVSCRDPFFYSEGENRFLLVNARIPFGPKIRRGCIGLAREGNVDDFQWEKPLFTPGMYDDIEVPGLYKIKNHYYLIGNIKEDVKIHYWHCDTLKGEYEAFASNVLLPKGNYAARITMVDGDYLLWNFFTDRSESVRTTILPPPTELKVDNQGELYLQSYRHFDKKVKASVKQEELLPIQRVLKNQTAKARQEENRIVLDSISGYEIFFLQKQTTDFRLRFKMSMEGLGKWGVTFRSDSETNGHFISLDLQNGQAQSRVWGENSGSGIENTFSYRIIQSNHFKPVREGICRVEVLAFGGYIELSIEERIILRYVETSYMDHSFLGFYVESASISLQSISLDILDGPEEEDHQIM
jgi:beta-fructofuranosidase